MRCDDVFVDEDGLNVDLERKISFCGARFCVEEMPERDMGG